MSEKRRDSKGRVLRNGESQRADGMYMFRYTDPGGSRKTVYSWKLVSTDKAPDGKRCVDALRDIEKRIQKDIDDGVRTSDANKITVNDQFKSFMDLRLDLKETTRCNYLTLYNKHVRGRIGDKPISSIRHTDIQRMYVEMYKTCGLSVATIQSVHSILYQLFNNAVLDGLIRANPSADVLKNLKKMFSEKPRKRHALTEQEQSALVDFVYSAKVYKRWGNLITVLLGTGMRISEALGLRWCDCDFDEMLISVNHSLLYKESESGSGYEYRISETKTDAGVRTIPMFSDVRDALKRERTREDRASLPPFSVDGYTDFIFLNSCGKVFTPSAVFEILQGIVRAYNKKEKKRAKAENREPILLPRFSAHILRHTFCTRLCENEPNLKVVQDVMGHRNIKTTMDVYNEATKEKKKSSFESLDGKIKLS